MKRFWSGGPGVSLRERVLGCFWGKSIGGTAGMPFEGSEECPGLELCGLRGGGMVANDDLDLQLIWLDALERHGASLGVSEMGRCYRAALDAHWDEYGVALRNLGNGLEPPWSGSYDNFFVCGLGAAIRSEIWAMVFAGRPEVAARWAAADASIDHAGEGVDAEVFNAVVEAVLLGGGSLAEALARGKAALPPSSLANLSSLTIESRLAVCFFPE